MKIFTNSQAPPLDIARVTSSTFGGGGGQGPRKGRPPGITEQKEPLGVIPPSPWIRHYICTFDTVHHGQFLWKWKLPQAITVLHTDRVGPGHSHLSYLGSDSVMGVLVHVIELPLNKRLI